MAEKEIMEAIQKSKDMNILTPLIWCGCCSTSARINNNLNLGLSAFGMNPMQSVLPEAVEQGGLRGLDLLMCIKTQWIDLNKSILTFLEGSKVLRLKQLRQIQCHQQLAQCHQQLAQCKMWE